MVLKDGKKYACSSCLKGHRVSGCTHTDRELFEVAKKGRPVTQCHHCRAERKKRSAHVRCDCGEIDKPHHSREKCIHLREAEERAKAGLPETCPQEKDAAHIVAVADEQGCCCHHGGKCSCSLLKKGLDGEDDLPHGPAVKPHLKTTRSDGSLTLVQNGHHKPIHRNHAAQNCEPYRMPLSRSNTEYNVARAARRSIDSLATIQHANYEINNMERQRVMSSGHQALHLPDAIVMPIDDPQIPHFYMSTAEDNHQFSRPQSALQVSPQFSGHDLSPNTYSNDYEWMSTMNGAAGCCGNAFDVWSAYAEATGMMQPPLTAGSSGTQSEIDESPNVDDMYSIGMPSIRETTVNATDDSDLESFNRRNSPANFIAVPAGNLWDEQTPINLIADTNSKATSHASTPAFVDPWQAVLSMPISTSNYLPSQIRPSSQSVDSTTLLGDEAIKELFPDFDPNVYLSNNETQPNNGVDKPYMQVFDRQNQRSISTPDLGMNLWPSNDNNTFGFGQGSVQNSPGYDYTQTWTSS